MKVSFATVGISGTFSEKLSAIAAAKFDGIEIFEGDLLAFSGSAKTAGEMVREYGLEVSLLQPFRNFEGNPEPQRALAFHRAEKKFDLMQELGTDLMLMCSNISPHAKGCMDQAIEDLYELGTLAAKWDIRIGYEALSWGRYINDHRDAWELVRRVNHPNIGLILDSFHSLSRNIDVHSIRSIPGDKIFFVQIADAPLLDMDLLQWSRHFRNMPGQGDLDLKGFMQSVLATGYTGPISLEIFNDQFWNASPFAISNDGYKALMTLMSDVHLMVADETMTLPKLPDRSEIVGIERLELITDHKTKESLSEILLTLGFSVTKQSAKAGYTQWEQGNICIALTSKDIRCEEANNTVMPIVSSYYIGLLVADSEAAASRANGLDFAVSKLDTYDNSQSKYVVRASGVEICFFEDKPRLFETNDIETEIQQPHSIDIGLKSIDHLSLLSSNSDALRRSLLYNSIFATKKSPVLELLGPTGLIRSQFIESSTSIFRIKMTQVMADRELPTKTIGGLQGITLSTDDIFQTANLLQQNGFAALPISQNYYSDLSARLKVPSATLFNLKKFNILYHQDAHGAYYQLFSQCIGDSLFFEIVQRSGNYEGYGTPIEQISSA